MRQANCRWRLNGRCGLPDALRGGGQLMPTAAVILTSFRRQHRYPGEAWSVARSQPSGCLFPGLPFLAAVGPAGEPIKDPGRSPRAFQAAYRDGLLSRWGEVRPWLDSLSGTTKLCCWCPYSSVRHGEYLFCHTGLIGILVNRYRPDISLYWDDDRERLYPPWMPAGELWRQDQLQLPFV